MSEETKKEAEQELKPQGFTFDDDEEEEERLLQEHRRKGKTLRRFPKLFDRE
jgi:hypothetical protein